MQLCRQVQQELHFILGDCADDIVRDLMVEDVQPAPDASRLAVVVNTELSPRVVLKQLYRMYGYIRTEIASAINRKRVPELIFQCVDRSKDLANGSLANDSLTTGDTGGEVS